MRSQSYCVARWHWLALCLALAGCGGEPAGDPESAAAVPAPFLDATTSTGLGFTHDPGVTAHRYMPEIMGAGVGLLDIDNDGDLDVYMMQGGSVDGESAATPDRLFRNDLADSGPVFVDVTESSGIPGSGYGMGIATGDIDGDGHTDIYLANFGANVLLRNRGDGTFEDVTRAAGAGDERWTVPATFFDYDNDGDHDLFVGNYVDFRVSGHRECVAASGLVDYCSPHTYSAVADRLLNNDGSGVFEDVTSASGIRSVRSKALGVSASDFNGDGRVDLYVANDGVANQLWINQGDGTFEDTALLSGSALNFEGSPEASMGVDAADVDADGDEDLFITHLRGETNTLYMNRGNAVFEDQTIRMGLAGPSIPLTGFGTAWVDFDNDGRLDLFAANGAVTIEERRIQNGDAYPFDQRNQLFMNVSGADGLRFEEYDSSEDAVLSSEYVSRGAAFGDLDNDGDVDVVIANNNGTAQVLLNQLGQDNQWIGLDLRYGDNNVVALGAVASVKVEDKRQVRRVRTSGSYASANDPRIVFGLGDADLDAIDVEVTWVDGSTERFVALATNSYHTLVQGSGE